MNPRRGQGNYLKILKMTNICGIPKSKIAGFQKQKLQGNSAELRTKNNSNGSEGELLCQKNRVASAQVESSKTQLNEHVTRIAQIQDERVQNERALQLSVGLQSILNDSRGRLWICSEKLETGNCRLL